MTVLQTPALRIHTPNPNPNWAGLSVMSADYTAPCCSSGLREITNLPRCRYNGQERHRQSKQYLLCNVPASPHTLQASSTTDQVAAVTGATSGLDNHRTADNTQHYSTPGSIARQLNHPCSAIIMAWDDPATDLYVSISRMMGPFSSEYFLANSVACSAVMQEKQTGETAWSTDSQQTAQAETLS